MHEPDARDTVPLSMMIEQTTCLKLCSCSHKRKRIVHPVDDAGPKSNAWTQIVALSCLVFSAGICAACGCTLTRHRRICAFASSTPVPCPIEVLQGRGAPSTRHANGGCMEVSIAPELWQRRCRYGTASGGQESSGPTCCWDQAGQKC
jgi:hypothetical protein